MKEKFQDIRFTDASVQAIDRVNSIIEDYARQGYRLSIRQLHYQFVSRNWYANTKRNVKNLESLVSNGRMAGLIDWDAIEDRNRETQRVETWDSMGKFLQRLNNAYRRSKWKNQANYVEVMVEKQALEGILLPVCNRWEVAFTANKGYSSSSSLYERGKYLQSMRDVEKKQVHVIYLGDHDPSGIDMTRDVLDRLSLFSDGAVNVHRVALNLDQVTQWKLPENPAKMTDSRAEDYVEKFGEASWELDAIPPAELVRLVEGQITSLIERTQWNRDLDTQNRERSDLQDIIEGMQQ